MSKTLRELVDSAAEQALNNGSLSDYAELLRQAVMLEVREAWTMDPETFGKWLDGECEGQE